jgi:hypothetical protein
VPSASTETPGPGPTPLPTRPLDANRDEAPTPRVELDGPARTALRPVKP